MHTHDIATLARRAAVAFIAAVSAITASAKTIALWPIEYDSARGGFDYRCRIDPANDLYDPASKNMQTEGVGWTLPPNPDGSLRNEFALNASAISNTDTGTQAAMLKNDYAGAYVVGTNDFTLEGFFKFNQNFSLSYDKFYIIAAWLTGDNNNRFLLQLRRQTEGGGGKYQFRIYGAVHTGKGNKDGTVFSDTEIESLTNSWHHFAIVYRHNTSAGKATTQLYIDGTRHINVSVNAINSLSSTPANSILEFGGRTSGNSRAPLQLDYLRLSDEALDPSGFLNAGGAGTTVPASPTVAYWKLSADENGIDGSSSVGGLPLGDVWQSNHTNTVTLADLEVSHDSAFDGLPPNTSMSPAATLSASNTGSFRVMHESVALWHPTLGLDLVLTNSFTVEGWLKPERSLNYEDDIQVIWTTRNWNNQGWMLELKHVVAGWGLAVFANDTTQDIRKDTVVVPVLDEWTDWKHVGLVYDAETDNGVWSIYLDGALAGCITNTVKPSAEGTYANYPGFWAGGRFRGRNFRGEMDYVRVSKTALRPEQFLCAADGEAATDVLALWPLDVINGVYFDGRDATGQNHIQSPRSASNATYHALPDTVDAPAITNPDSSPAFSGDPASTSGSVDFGDATVTRRHYLGTRDPATLAAVNSKSGLTLEGYFKRTAVPDNTWEVYFGFYRNVEKNSLVSTINIGVYKDRGFTVYDNNWATNWPYSGSTDINVTDFSNTVPDTDLGTWHHVAFTRMFTPTSVVWECFIDGVSQGTSPADRLCTEGDTPSHPVYIMFVGGRYTSAHHFKGKVSSIRVSNRVLAPSEFLCATGPAPKETETFGEWRSESAPLTLFNNSIFTAPANPFTIEYKAALSDGAETMLAGTWDAANKVGWKVVRAADGSVSVYARVDGRSTPYATGTFGTVQPGTPCLAVVYDPHEGKGTWKLYANGRLVGNVENLWTPSAASATQPWSLAIGDASMDTLTKVRFTGAALERRELIFDRGLVMFLR